MRQRDRMLLNPNSGCHYGKGSKPKCQDGSRHQYGSVRMPAQECHSRGHCFDYGVQPHCYKANACASNPCQHNGICMPEAGGYICECPAGWTGPDCSLEIKACASTPCHQGGYCVERKRGAYACRCAVQCYGYNCDVCVSSPTLTPIPPPNPKPRPNPPPNPGPIDGEVTTLI